MIGQAVIAELRRRGEHVVALSRDPERAARVLGADCEHHAWPSPQHAPPPEAALAGSDAVIHLLGEPIAQRWSAEVKREIRDSRVLSTRNLVEGLAALEPARRPRALVSQSATGYYGPRGDEELDEQAPPGGDFLAGVVVDWEREALAASELRVVTTRTGVVLSARGGALAKMLPPFRLGLGGPVAGGRQYVPWIHLDDAVAALIRCALDDALSGPVNVCAPTPVTNRELTRALARVLRRPAVLPVPAAALHVLYGEMAQVVTTGQRAVPAALRAAGHEFAHAVLEPALRDVLA